MLSLSWAEAERARLIARAVTVDGGCARTAGAGCDRVIEQVAPRPGSPTRRRFDRIISTTSKSGPSRRGVTTITVKRVRFVLEACDGTTERQPHAGFAALHLTVKIFGTKKKEDCNNSGRGGAGRPEVPFDWLAATHRSLCGFRDHAGAERVPDPSEIRPVVTCGGKRRARDIRTCWCSSTHVWLKTQQQGRRFKS